MAGGSGQPRALAGGARLAAEIFRQFIAHLIRFGFPVAALHVGNHALERMAAAVAFTATVLIIEIDCLAAAAVQDDRADAFRQVLKRRLHIEMKMPRQCFDQLEVVEIFPVPTAHRPARQTEVRVRHHPFRIEKLLDAQAVARRARADRIVEGKQARFQFAQAVTAHRAGEPGREQPFRPFRLVQKRQPRDAVGQFQRCLERLRQPQTEILAHFEAIHHHLDGVLAA